MWAYNLDARPADATGTRPAILSFTVGVRGADRKPISKLKLAPYGTVREMSTADAWILRDAGQAADVIAATREFQRGETMVIDFDHQSLLSRRRGIGHAGYIDPMSLKAEVDGIYGKVIWTPPAERSIQSNEYRYCATHVMAVRKDGQITRIIGAGLTNSPSSQVQETAEAAINHVTGEQRRMKMTEEERAICAALNVPEKDYLAMREAKAREIGAINAIVPPPVAGVLSPVEVECLAKLGLSRADYLKTRDSAAS